MSDFLQQMADASLRRAAATRAHPGADELRDTAGLSPPPVPLRLSSSHFDLIAEVKLATPSQGRLVEGGVDEVIARARTYRSRNVAAISVLTEPDRFAGSLGHLEAVASAVDVPVLRKDFLVDPIQVLEARAAGASGILVIARILPGEVLEEMTDLAMQLGMFVIVEIFDTSDLKRVVRVFDRDVLVGVNCRDLATLAVDRRRFAELAPHLPDHLPAVAESGIEDPEHAAQVARLGYGLALVGSSLMLDHDPGSKLDRLIEAGRRALAGVA